MLQTYNVKGSVYNKRSALSSTFEGSERVGRVVPVAATPTPYRLERGVYGVHTGSKPARRSQQQQRAPLSAAVKWLSTNGDLRFGAAFPLVVVYFLISRGSSSLYSNTYY